MDSSTSFVDLLIVGAGPAGLTAACWAAQYNMSTRIIDQKDGRTQTGHADGLQSRTLEILESFGIADPILKQGVQTPDSCHWTTNNKTGNIERLNRYESNPREMPRLTQVLLNQGAVEQVFNDYLDSKGKFRVEWNKLAESINFSAVTDENNKQFPVVVKVRCFGECETIHARYLVACDGAHSWARGELGVSTDTVSEDSTWGVLDIVPITDFPDIRRSCSINCQPHGSIMTVPRENRLVRLYIHLRALEESSSKHPGCSPTAILERVQSIIRPYNLTYRYCDWWSIYSIGRRLVRQYRPHERVFLAGDAAHTHSPTGGQGMNVSIQDTYNLLWKLGEVITSGADPIILETYESERRPVAKDLMTLDSRLVKAYEEEEDQSGGIYEIRDQYAGFMAGIDITYPHNMLIAKEGEAGVPKLAKSVKLGMRLPSFPVVYQCDGVPTQIAQILVSDGAWRLLVFSGDLRKLERMRSLARFSESFSKNPHLTYRQQKQSEECRPIMKLLLIQSSPRSALSLLDLPELFHPFDDTMGWDYWKVFNDDLNQAYLGYGIDEGGPGCLVLCRPDQHVAWIGSLENTSSLSSYFSTFLGSL